MVSSRFRYSLHSKDLGLNLYVKFNRLFAIVLGLAIMLGLLFFNITMPLLIFAEAAGFLLILLGIYGRAG
jgi:hypothetical protein